MADDAYDPAFAALPFHLQERIDAAFDTAQLPDSDELEPTRKRRKVEHSPQPQPGGFLVDEPAPGGFIPKPSASGGSSSDSERRTHIPFSLIPTALQILDLAPDDEDVLSVFRNAASGWGELKRGRADENELERGSNQEDGALVSRKDWRAVCAALLDTGADDRDDVHMDEDGLVDRSPTGTDRPEEAPSDSGEDYVQSDGGDSDVEVEDDSDDDYRGEGGGFVRSKKMKTSPKTRGGTRTLSGKGRSTAESDEEERGKEPRGLTTRQKKECRAAFSLFFPDVTDDELDKQRIRIKDITRVAKLLKEKVTAEETVEMLEAFSTAADKSMGLADFERMMIAAKLA
ncbi:hypothetical protein C8Q70DRAFT_918680 [Cubamyces menziesii]|nr:hypothetical protein C8Q70DRAFT_918680 [Cubamyces menziesii]